MFRPFVLFVSFVAHAVGQEKVTYDGHVLPIFQQACLNCHNPDKAKGGLDLSSFAGTVKGSSGGKIVEPGDVTSTLIKVVEQTATPKMPPEGAKLADPQIQILKRWIEGGMLENPASSARKPTKPKFESTPGGGASTKPDGPPPMPEDVLLEPLRVTARPSAVHALAISPWAPLLAITSEQQVLLFHSETYELAGILPFPEGDPVSLAFTPDARYLIVGGGVPGKSGITVVFDVVHGSRLLAVAKEFDSILAADIRPGFDIVATGGPSRMLKLWNCESGSLIKSIKKHTDWITALDISLDGVLLASGDRNGGVWVWESDTGNEFHTLRAHQAAITAAVFRADSNILATSSEDGTVRFWEMNGGSEIKKIDAHPGGVSAFSFARDGSFLTAGRDLKARLWKADFNPARDLSAKLPALPTAVALDPEGKRAFIGDAEGGLLVLDTTDGKTLATLKNNPPSIGSRLQNITAEIDALKKSIASENGDATKAKLASLEKSHKHWNAASINTRLIETRRTAETATLKTDEAQDDFTQVAEKITQQAAILNGKRAARNQLSRFSMDHSPEAVAEIKATLDVLDLVIARELESLHSIESEMEAQRRTVDDSAQLCHETKSEAEALRQAYQQAQK